MSEHGESGGGSSEKGWFGRQLSKVGHGVIDAGKGLGTGVAGGAVDVTVGNVARAVRDTLVESHVPQTAPVQAALETAAQPLLRVGRAVKNVFKLSPRKVVAELGAGVSETVQSALEIGRGTVDVIVDATRRAVGGVMRGITAIASLGKDISSPEFATHRAEKTISIPMGFGAKNPTPAGPEPTFGAEPATATGH